VLGTSLVKTPLHEMAAAEAGGARAPKGRAPPTAARSTQGIAGRSKRGAGRGGRRQPRTAYSERPNAGTLAASEDHLQKAGQAQRATKKCGRGHAVGRGMRRMEAWRAVMQRGQEDPRGSMLVSRGIRGMRQTADEGARATTTGLRSAELPHGRMANKEKEVKLAGGGNALRGLAAEVKVRTVVRRRRRMRAPLMIVLCGRRKRVGRRTSVDVVLRSAAANVGGTTTKSMAEVVASGSWRGSASRPAGRGCRVPKRVRSPTSGRRVDDGAEAAPPLGPARRCTVPASPPVKGGGCGVRIRCSVPEGGTWMLRTLAVTPPAGAEAGPNATATMRLA
jgi:hypothetical protein